MKLHSVLGRPLELRVRTPALLRWLADRWIFPAHILPPVAFGISVEEVDASEGPEPDSGEDGWISLHRVSLRVHRGPSAWRFGDHSAGLSLRLPPDGGSRIRFWGVDRPGGLAAVTPPLFLALAESLRASGILPLHAAVVSRGDSAVALSGPSGIGKSTTFSRWIQDGWTPIAEDFAWLDPGTLRVYGWDRGVRLRPDSIERLGLPPGGVGNEVGEDGKVFLPFHAVGGGSGPGSARLGRLLVLQATADGGVEGEAIPAREAIRALWEAVGVPMSEDVRARVASDIASVASRVEISRFHRDSPPPATAGPIPPREPNR